MNKTGKIGVGLIIGACVVSSAANTTDPDASTSSNWYLALMFPLMILSPLPILMAANCATDNGMLFASKKSGPAVEFGFFITGILLTSIFATPITLLLAGRIEILSACLAVTGAILVLSSVFMYHVIFNMSLDDNDD